MDLKSVFVPFHFCYMIQNLKQIFLFFVASTLQLHVQFDSDVNLVQCDKDLKAHSH